MINFKFETLFSFKIENINLPILGGSSDVSVTSGQVYSTGFSGCVSQSIKIGYTNNPQSVSFDTSLVGQYVKPCSV